MNQCLVCACCVPSLTSCNVSLLHLGNRMLRICPFGCGSICFRSGGRLCVTCYVLDQMMECLHPLLIKDQTITVRLQNNRRWQIIERTNTEHVPKLIRSVVSKIKQITEYFSLSNRFYIRLIPDPINLNQNIWILYCFNEYFLIQITDLFCQKSHSFWQKIT